MAELTSSSELTAVCDSREGGGGGGGGGADGVSEPLGTSLAPPSSLLLFLANGDTCCECSLVSDSDHPHFHNIINVNVINFYL